MSQKAEGETPPLFYGLELRKCKKKRITYENGAGRMEIITMDVDELHEYENNPRLNENAVEPVAESIREFGFKVPILIDKDNVIIAGHTRLKAARSLGMDEVPCIRCEDLSPEQVKAFRLADNKVGEFADWDLSALNIELGEIEMDMERFGFFDLPEVDIDQFLSDHVKEPTDKAEEPKRIQCPHCGEWFDVT